MKKTAIFLLVLTLLAVSSYACAANNDMPDLSRTARIEVRAFTPHDQTYTDYTISDEDTIFAICDALSSLNLKRIKLTEPLAMSYSLTFYYPNGGRIASLALVFGHNVIDCGNMYKIKNDLDINSYIYDMISELKIE